MAALEVLPSPPSLLVVPRPAAPTPRRLVLAGPARAAAHLGVLARSVELPVESSRAIAAARLPPRRPGPDHAAPASADKVCNLA